MRLGEAENEAGGEAGNEAGGRLGMMLRGGWE